MRAALLMMMALLVVPSVAGFTPATDVREYHQIVHSDNGSGPLGGMTDTINVSTPHGFEVVERQSVFDVIVNLRLESGIGNREIEFTFETDQGHSCSWRVAIGTQLEATNPLSLIACPNGPVPDGATTWWLNQTQISGGDPVMFFHLTIELRQRDTVTTMTDFEALTGLTGLEFFAVFGIAAGLLMVGVTTRHVAAKAMCGWLVIVLAVLLLFFHSSAVVVVLAVGLGLGGAVVLFLLALERLKKEPGPRQFFE